MSGAVHSATHTRLGDTESFHDARTRQPTQGSYANKILTRHLPICLGLQAILSAEQNPTDQVSNKLGRAPLERPD